MSRQFPGSATNAKDADCAPPDCALEDVTLDPRSPSTNPTSSAQDSGDDGACPTPLAWQQVVEAFSQESRVHAFDDAGRQSSVWTIGDGPPLYLLNGFLGDARIFALLVWLLREESTCVVIDWPRIQFPLNKTPTEQLKSLAQSVLRAADSLGHQKFRLHATSFGSLVGLQLLLDAADRVGWASLQGGFASRRSSLTERSVLSFARRSSRLMGQVTLAMMIQRQNHQCWFPPFDITRWRFYEEQAAMTPLHEMARFATLASRIDLRSRLSEILTRILIVQTEGDGRVAMAAQQDMADRLPNCTIECLDNCGAIPHVTHPHRLVKLIRQFRDE